MELWNWVAAGRFHVSEELRNQLGDEAFDEARREILASLRDGGIQPLGYVIDQRTEEQFIASSGSPMRALENLAASKSNAPHIDAEGFSRIPPSFWRRSEIDWHSEQASFQGLQYTHIYCLMQEVLEQWPDPEGQEFDAAEKLVPASDRVVRRDDNSAAFDEAANALDEAISVVAKANDIGDLTAGERMAVLSQLREGRKLFDLPEVKVSAIKALVEPKLRWLADKAGGAIVGSAALTALAAIAKLLVMQQ